ncbi:glycosyltransferase family 9 protein [Humitalea sp. 24SJ18S-53]|uniref:glycosyltransferase family 9 protein n=1 Tax=Humitalea sp. 24SJ18S-53 TaxID=3422307 RepID=UPI003D6746E4
MIPRTVGVFSTGETFGDAIYKIVFCRALRATYPGARITWFVTGTTLYASSLSSVAAPLLDDVRERCGIGASPREFLARLPEGIGPFDLLIDTQSLAWRTAAVWRVTHGRFVSAIRPPQKPAGPHVLDRLFALIGDPPRDLAPLPVPDAIRAAAEAALPGDAPRLAIAPGAGGVKKIWPLDRFIAVAKTRSETPVFLLGPAEAPLRAAIADALPQAIFPLEHPAIAASGGPQPLATIALAARCRIGLSNDSGAGHMIAASGTPLVSLFGPSSATKFRPIGPRVTVLRAQDHGGADMALLPVAAVLAALG